MVDTTGTGTASTSWTYSSGCSYRLPCGRCRLTMDMCPEKNCGNAWWGTDFDKVTYTADPNTGEPLVVTLNSTTMTEEAKDTIKKLFKG